MARRGRRPRAAAPSDERIEVRVTLDELRSLKELATYWKCSMADLLRIGALRLAVEPGQQPLALGRELIRRIVSGSKAPAVVQLNSRVPTKAALPADPASRGGVPLSLFPATKDDRP